MKSAFAILILSVFALFATAMNEDLPNLQNPRFEVYTSGQPTEGGFEQLSAMGVKSVINVLPEKECLPGELEMAQNKNMEYHSFPFDPVKIKLEDVQQFGVLLQNQKKPVLIHCSTGNHVGGMWFAYRILVEKASLVTALKEARKIGMKPEMEDAMFIWVVNEKEKLEITAPAGS
jgi:protein tyrosine phosphatase (PTP) superfamily phosphohydrolase (DUF442 family)